MTFLVGLTGGIGSGKSTVANLFVAHGAGLIDTDEIAHRLTQPRGRAIEPIRQAFGASFIDINGAMDRKTMRELVFADVEAKNKLEQLLHPLIRETVLEELAHISASYTLLAVPLLVETGTYLKMVNRVLVIDCEEATQIHRVMARSKLTEAEVRAIMLKQASRKARLAFADDVINNDGTSDSLQSQVDTLDTLYNELSRQINQ